MKWLRVGLFLLLLTGFVFANQRGVVAETEEEKLVRLTQEIEQYESEIAKLQSQANTLSNQIASYDTQIRLTQLKIDKAQEEINRLGSRIESLAVSLDSLTTAFSSRATQTYKMARLGEPLMLLVSSADLTKAVSSYHYLQKIQQADRDLLVRLESAQTAYIDEKVNQEDLEVELQEQENVLAAQKSAKAQLLSITKSDEQKYQDLLARALAEFDAIQAIFAGKGDETLVREVGPGERIASIIAGSSACSSGAHLHFEVAKNNINQNPASYLSNKTVIWNNSPDGPFGFGGSWPWPINDPVRITQGYGQTYYASTLKYYGGAPHTGIDMVGGSDYEVKAVQQGTLYRGAIACGGGTLRYVKVKHAEGLDTYYLHINY